LTKEMKDSGVEWIGEVPIEWETRRLKVALVREKEIVAKYSNEDILSLTKGGVVVRDLVNPKGKMPTTFDGYQLITKGNIVTCLFDIDVTPRCVGIANNDGLTSPAYTQYKVINKFDLDFIYYYLLMLDNDKILVPITKSLRNTIKSEDFLNLEFSFPNSILQKKISTRITASILRINQLIDETQQSIEELKKYKQSLITEAVTKGLDKNVEMQDSEFPFFDSIPKGWRVTKLGRMYEVILGKMLAPNQTENDWTLEKYYSAANINFSGISDEPYKRMWFSPKDKRIYKVNIGDLLVVEGGAGAGGSSIVENLLEDTYIQNSVLIIRSKESMENKFLYYILFSLMNNGYMQHLGNIATFSHYTKEKVSETPIIVPSPVEQVDIINFLTEKTNEIDQLIKGKRQIIQELLQYKKSLIYEYVTGKKEV